MQDNIKDRYFSSSPIRQTIEILEDLSSQFYGDDLETARAMQVYNQIIRDVTGVTPHWAEVA